MQWHQLDHMQTICTSLQTDNHTSSPNTSSLTAKSEILDQSHISEVNFTFSAILRHVCLYLLK